MPHNLRLEAYSSNAFGAYARCMKDIDATGPLQLGVRDLKLVLALATARTTARAASVLYLTQPAVSRALQNAEQRLGGRLFDRTAPSSR